MSALDVPEVGQTLHRRGAVRSRSPDPCGSRRLSHSSSARGSHLSVDCGPPKDQSRLSIDSQASGHSFASVSTMASLPATPEPIFLELADTRLSFPVPVPHIKPSLSIHIPNGAPPHEPTIVFGQDQDIVEPYVTFPSSSSSASSPPILPTMAPQHSLAPGFPTTSELRSHPSIMIRRGYTVKRRETAESAESAYDEPEETFESERVRVRRMNMAEALMARRKLERRRDKHMSSGTNYGTLDEEDSWYDSRDRAKHFQEWERREAEALASERRWKEEVDRDRVFREYQRGMRREDVVNRLRRVH